MIHHRFLLSHPAHFIALGFGSGLSWWGPGTVGTLWAWVSYMAMDFWLSPAQIGWVLLAALPIGWGASTVTAEHLVDADPSAIVIDEIVAFWAVLWIWMPAGLWGQVAAFSLFRTFDVLKPGPVRWVDRYFHGWGWRGGFGIMADDIVAAFLTLLILALWQATQ